MTARQMIAGDVLKKTEWICHTLTVNLALSRLKHFSSDNTARRALNDNVNQVARLLMITRLELNSALFKPSLC